MELRTIEPLVKNDETHMHTFVCDTCAHELRVMNDRADYERLRSDAIAFWDRRTSVRSAV
jgi:hypothetical protein